MSHNPPDVRDLTDKQLARLINRESKRLGYGKIDPVTLSEQVSEETADDLEQLTWIAHNWPLALARLWSKEDAPCDQRRAVIALMGVDVLCLLGGNRSGKSYAAKELTVAMALGGDHPAVVAWLTDNDLPLDLIPPGPADVFAVAQSGPDSVRYHRDDVDALLPPGDIKWRNRNIPQEAVVTIEVPGYDRRAKIWFKAVDQKARSFRGAECRFIWIDEEPEGEEGRRVFEECQRAVSSQGGQVLLSYTPHNGYTWTYEAFEERGGAKIVRLDSLHNDLVDNPEGVRRWLESLPEDQQRMRRFGIYTDLRGMIFGEWSRGDGSKEGPGNVCEPFEIPEDWPRFMGGDWGLKNPTALVWGALGDDGTIYVYREHEQAGPSYAEHAKIAHELMGNVYSEHEGLLEENEEIEGFWADPSSPEAIDAFAERDMPAELANRDVKEGIDAIRDRIRLHGDSRPRIKVFRTCPKTIHTIENYRWNPKTKSPTPIKKRDHLVDALRYMVRGIDEWEGV